jgi:hypothetical protein
MSARDLFHYEVRRALEKEGWIVSADPLTINFGEDDKMQIDLAAERLLVATRGTEKIAVEIKSFLNDSALSDFYQALGQVLSYRFALAALEPDRILYLAIPVSAYDAFFQRDLPKALVKQHQLKLIVYDPKDEVIVKWNA